MEFQPASTPVASGTETTPAAPGTPVESQPVIPGTETTPAAPGTPVESQPVTPGTETTPAAPGTPGTEATQLLLNQFQYLVLCKLLLQVVNFLQLLLTQLQLSLAVPKVDVFQKDNKLKPAHQFLPMVLKLKLLPVFFQSQFHLLLQVQ